MRVLMISGDSRMMKQGTEANRRYQLQARTVERLDLVLFPGPLGPLLTAFQTRYDVVTTQDPFGRGLVGWVVALVTGARLNVQVHAELGAQSGIKRALAQFVLARATSVRAVSEKIKTDLIVRLPAGRQARISVLPVFVDLTRFRSITRAPRANPTVLWVGRFEPEKDPLLAVHVFKHTLTAIPNATFVMLGTGSLAARLRRAADEAGITVEFPGWQDPAHWYAQADALLVTSPAESYGAAIVEALAAGVPVVSPDVGVAREAGATIATREHLVDALVSILTERPRSTLMLPILDEAAWVEAWHATLT